MKLSIVIGTYNRCAVLREHLPAVLEQDFPPAEFEVVVVIDGSTDGTAAMLREVRSRCALRVLEQPNQGLPAARDAGVAVARGEIILFLDDDIRCPRNLVRLHVEAHDAASSPRVVFGPVRVDPQSPRTIANQWLQQVTDRYCEEVSAGGEVSPTHAYLPPNSSVPLEVLQRTGAIPRSARIRFDLDHGLHLWTAGVAFHYLPEAETFHRGTKSCGELVRDARSMGAGELEVLRRHPVYRQYSWLGRISAGPGWKRLARRQAALRPWLLAPVDALISATEWLRGFAIARRAGLKALHLRCAAAQWQGAAEAVGGWQALVHEVEQLCSGTEEVHTRAAAARGRVP